MSSMSTMTMTMTMPTTPITNGRTDKASKKQSKTVVLQMSPSLLKRFAPKKASPSIASSPAPTIEATPQLKTVSSQENPSEHTSTPAPARNTSIPIETTTSKPPTTNGVKRSTPMLSEGTAKPRGKPGPKKKPRLEDGTIDHSAKPAATGTANHKLGPKANTGFINANLRALDRSGNPCRRWQKRGFALKSFTGHSWELPSWRGSSRHVVTDGTSDDSNKDISISSDQKPSESDTAAGSNVGDHLDKLEIMTPVASSPPAIPAAPPMSLQP